jgi:peptide/nickel transport system substrate-binding protein
MHSPLFPSTRSRGRRWAAVAAGVTVVALALGGCAAADNSPSATESATPVSGGTLTFARTAAVTSLDLHTEITANNAFAIDKIFEPLLTFDAEGAIQPAVASEYSQSDDGLTWTFTIRDGITFSNGEAVTPADVVFSLNRHITTENSPLPLNAPITDIVAEGDNTVVVTLSSPYTPFAAELAGFANGILPADLAGQSPEEFFANPIGTGPFVVDSWEQGGEISFVKNENYWQDGKPYVDKLVYTLVPDDNQLVAQLTGGQVDAIDEVPEANVADLEANPAVSVVSTDSWNVEELFFNNLDEHFADRNVRRAIALAIDKEGIVEATSFGTAKVAGSLLPPSIEYYSDDIDTLSLDLDKAKDEIAQSAFPDGFETTLLVASGNTLRAQAAQAIQQQLAPLGITVNIESIDLAAFRARFRAFDYEFMLNGATSDTPDPNSIISFQADPDAGTNAYWTHYSNDEVTALLHEGTALPEGDEREATYMQIQELIAQDAPYVPLSYPAAIKGTSSKVHDFVVLPNGSTRLQDAWIEQ